LSASALHTLAQAIAWSIVILIPATICLGSDLANWIEAGTADDHLESVLFAGYATILLPFPVGAGIGLAARALAARGRTRLMRIAGSTDWGEAAPEQTARVSVSFVDDVPPIVGLLRVSDSKPGPDGQLSITAIEAGSEGQDVIVLGHQIRAV